MSDPVFETYEGLQFTIEFVNNGYLLSYKCPSRIGYVKEVFVKWKHVVNRLKEIYSGEWE